MQAQRRNCLDLDAAIAETQPLRRTPGGLPAMDLLLEHESVQDDAGQPRQVRASLRAVAFGTVAERIALQAHGSEWRFQGFLGNRSRSRQTVFHIQDFQNI